jgi:ferredoxin-NADP reductase
MATARTARIIRAEQHGDCARVLTLELADASELGFVGGQYVIVNTGIPIDDGKVVKRCYSVISADRQQTRFELAMRPIEDGPASNYMCRAPAGTEISFSGPWGKLRPEPDEPAGPTFVLATDTGITAALGLVNGDRFAPRRPQTRMLWYVESPDYFLPESEVRARVPGQVDSFARCHGVPVGDRERGRHAQLHVRDLLQGSVPDSAFLVGDGEVLYPVRDALIALGVPAQAIRIECFFNSSARQVAA